MYTPAATAMTTMLATTATATNYHWSLATLAFGIYLMIVGLMLLMLWVIRTDDINTPAPGDNSRKTQIIIRVAAMVIGLLIIIASFTALPPSTP